MTSEPRYSSNPPPAPAAASSSHLAPAEALAAGERGPLPVLSCAEMKEVEQSAFAAGITAEALMEEAGAKIAAAVRQFVPGPGRCVVHFGKGNNGGDALVAARYLVKYGWDIELCPAFPAEAWGALTALNHHRLTTVLSQPRTTPSPVDRLDRLPLVALDGLLGIGAGGELREPIRSATAALNQLAVTANARIFAIDVPTGLDADTGEPCSEAVEADFTLTIGTTKRGLLADAAINHVGRLAVLPLTELTSRLPAVHGPMVATREELLPMWPRRPFDIHKGDCGRVGIVAGSLGFSGAAVMSAEAALHAGAGLVTLYVSPEIQGIVAARMSPEIMVQTFTAPRTLLAKTHTALAVGPGVGRQRDTEILDVIGRAPCPTIIDADGLNALAARSGWLWAFNGPRLVTPHPGEMERLVPGSIHKARREVAERFVDRYPVALLLKGARTIVAERGKPLSYNTTGSPGMATGGMGDVLTGVCVALAGQGLELYDSARLGAWLCGRAAELAVFGGQSEESLSATHVISHLGTAFRELREAGY